ncbi:MAG TPA: hypothetical protein VK168_20665 [Saprospiraceae bacterium]|nr:hypothetical protein [Saprospiraceae bacterium]
MNKQTLHEQLEAYLRGALSPEQMAIWQQKIESDPALQKELELHQAMDTDFDAGRIRLRQQLDQVMSGSAIGDRSKRRRLLIFFIAVLISGALAGWYFFKNQGTTPPLPELPNSPVRPDNVQNQQPAAPVMEKDPPPIAKVSPDRFAPNQAMEANIRSGIRSESVQVVLKPNATNAVFKRDTKGQTRLNFEGTLMGTGANLEPLEWLIFDNQNNRQPLTTLSFSLVATGEESYTFSLIKTVNFEPGLYYFTLENPESGSILYTGKFQIR